MEYFKTYWSDTLAGSGNQNWFAPEDPAQPITGRAYYRLFAGGQQNYSLLFSNIIDSTYSDGSHSKANTVCETWELLAGRIGLCAAAEEEPEVFCPLTFEGKDSITVLPGMFFHTDPVALSARAGAYLCLELTFRGTKLPYLEETLIPTYRKSLEGWVKDQRMPLAAMVGSDREIEKRIAFWGDSITEGLGTEEDGYLHWNARIAEKVGPKYGYWNLGIGFGRAADAASCGAWFYKARQADLVNVCYGVNDILHGYSAGAIKRNLRTIVTELKRAGCKVGLFTVPPFDYAGETLEKWLDVTEFILTELALMVDYLFDVRPDWGQDAPLTHMARYGGHPDAAGCEALAQRFAETVKL